MMKMKKIRLMASAAAFLILTAGGLAYYQYAYAVTRTWDGGGTDGTCGGAGTANNWTCAANWSGDTVPTASDIALFDATSTKNATINASISVAGISIAAGYTGTITQSSTYTVTVGASHWVQAGGTFTGGSGAIDINGTYALSGGTFTSTTGIFEIGRVAGSETIFSISGGTFNHNNGTVRFAPSDTCTFNTAFTVDIATSLTLYDVTVNAIQMCGGANILTLASGDSIIIAHDFTQTDGILNGTWELQNNIVIGANADGSKDNGTFTMTGTGSKTYTYAAGGTGPNLRINNAGLSVSANAGTTDLRVALFSLIAGNFTAPSGTMTIGRSGSSETIFSISSGTFNHNNGTISFVPMDACEFNVYFTVDVITTLTLYNVTANLSQSCDTPPNLTTAAGDTIIVLGDFTHMNGVLNGVWEVRGNYTVTSAADGGTASITFTGGNSQTYTDQGGDESNGDITINKTAGTVTLASNADWNATGQDVTITAGTLAQSSYILNTNNFTVNGGTYTGGSGTLTTSGSLAISSGTFTGGSNNVNANVFSLSGGSFTAPSGTLAITESTNNSNVTVFTFSNGDFYHNNGIVYFDFNGGWTGDDHTIDIQKDIIFKTVYFDYLNAYSSGTGFSFSGVGTIAVEDSLYHIDGALKNRSIGLYGNLIVGSDASVYRYAASTDIVFMGGGEQTYSSSAAGETVNLTTNKTSGRVSPAPGTSSLNMGKLVIISGEFVAPTGTLNMSTYQENLAAILKKTGGTFTHNDGLIQLRNTVEGSGNPDWTNYIDGAFELYDLTFATNMNPLIPAGYAVTNGQMTVKHTFTINSGYFNAGSGGSTALEGDMVVQVNAQGGTASIAFTGGNSQVYTDQGGDEANGDIIVNKSSGAIALTSNADWNAAGQDVTVTAGTLSVGPGTLSTNTLTVAAGATFQMTSSGDLTLASTLTNNGLVHIWGNDTCGGSDAVQIRSSSSGVQRSWNGTGTFSIYDADIQDMAGTAAITVYSSTNNGNNAANWTFSGAACPAAALTPAMTLGTGSFYLGSGVVNLR